MNKLEEIDKYYAEMQSIQTQILQYISSNNNKENFQELTDFILNANYTENNHKLKAILHLLANIAENVYRGEDFFSKIEQFLLFLKDSILQKFSKEEIFIIFQTNKRILLFLFENGILIENSLISTIFLSEDFKSRNYPYYFYKEFKNFYKEEIQNEIETNLIDFENFETKRKIGENDNYLCELIRRDKVNDFISYINYENIPLSSEIKPSIFETNSFLIKRRPTLIEYSAFFGSINIFKYLLLSKTDFTSSLLFYAIHSNNFELIHILEDNEIKPDDDNYTNCYKEAIKCFNSELADYFENNFLTDLTENSHFLKYYNFYYFPKEGISLFDLCKYDHFIPVQIILKELDFNLKNQSEKSLLIIASEKGNIEIVQLLLECKGIDVNERFIIDIQNKRKRETTALTSAINNNYLEVSRLLLKRKEINVNSRMIITKHRVKVKQIERTALFLAVSNENVEIVKLLLKKRSININSKSILGYPRRREEKTCLIKAIEKRNEEIVSLLLNHPNIDVSIESFENKAYCRTRSLKTALFLAVEEGKSEIVKLLLNCDEVDVNKLSVIERNNVKEKKTPLCLAVEKNDAEIIELLLTHPQIKINFRSKRRVKKENNGIIKSQKSPLQIAIENNNKNIVDLLMNCSSIDVNNVSIVYIEQRSRSRLLVFLLISFFFIFLLTYSSINDNEYLGYFCQLTLLIMAIILF